ncbi:MAG: DUF882 domain-containing protein [Roseibium sp.]|uniref:YcbK family protein n=1 Tax=Roseibium sp. TaxID=1936156 RepID=UPI0032988320
MSTLIGRRGLILGATAALALGATGVPAFALSHADPIRQGSRLDRLVPSIDPVLNIVNAHTNERAEVRFFTADGYDKDAVDRLNWVWRDWRDNDAPQIDVRLWWALAAIRAAAMKDGHSGDQILLSGFRTQKTNELLRRRGKGAAKNSFHLKAKATDFCMEGIGTRDLAKFAKWLEVGGTGTYSRSGFVHIDSGEERTWGS